MADKVVTLQGAELLYKSNREDINKQSSEIQVMKDTKVDGAFVSEDGKYLHLTSNGMDLIGALGPFSGGGGGGGGSQSKLTVTNTTEWGRQTSIVSGASCIISVNWKSIFIEDEQPTGNGIITIKTSSEVLKTQSIPQGDFEFELQTYLKNGDNRVYLTIEDAYNATQTIIYNINVSSLSISSVFDESQSYASDINFAYTAVGELDKTVHFILDDIEIGTQVVSTSGRQSIFVIKKTDWVTHGHHKFKVYFTGEISGSTVTSNILNYDIICVIDGNLNYIISSTFDRVTVKKYETLTIPFYIYNPSSKLSTVYLTANGDTSTRQDVPNNALQLWSYKVVTSEGTLNLKIQAGNTVREFTLTIQGSVIPIEPATTAQTLYLSSSGRSNSAADRDIWKYTNPSTQETIQAIFEDFNWVSDGWLHDKSGYVALTLKGDARVTIPYKMFSKDFKNLGKTIELEFSTSDVNDYESTVISCMEGGRGIEATAQAVKLCSQQKTLSSQYKEDEHVRITFVVSNDTMGTTPESGNRIIYCYINGIISGTIQYPADDHFTQTNPVDITIGSSDVTTNIYNIRVYDRALTRFEVINNWICDMQDGAKILETYEHNNVFDAYDNIVIDKLPTDLPYMIVYPTREDGSHVLPQYKGDKVPASGSYVDPLHPERSFTFVGASMNVQGTSSQWYPRKNYKIGFKKGFDMTQSGLHVEKYAINPQAVPVKEFTFKADFASSEGCNNVELVRLYNDLTPYKTPAMKEDEESGATVKRRIGIDGFPIVIFYNNGENVTFLGKYNFNNDKGNTEAYGLGDDDESWEVTTNADDRALFKNDDFTSKVIIEGKEEPAWKLAFEARHPEDNENVAQLQVLSTWLKSTDRGNILQKVLDPVTGEEILIDTGIPVWMTWQEEVEGKIVYHGKTLDPPVVYDGKTYTEDNGDYRLAKYVHEFEDHLNKDSSIFYYLFTELFLEVDSRAKNAFPSIYREHNRWCWMPYDMDTAIGINNEGKLSFSYNLEDIDKVDGSDVFNGQNSVMWCNLRDGFKSDIQKQYIELVSKGLTYANVEKRYEDHQAKWPEAIFNEDAYFKYIKPLVNPDAGKQSEDYLEMCLGSKAEQRKWWLYNRFRYIDSKYGTGEAVKSAITFRAYSNGSIDVIPYADIYAKLKLGSQEADPYDSKRAKKNEVITLFVDKGESVVTDLDCSIYSADQLKECGNLSVFTPGTCNFAAGTKLQKLVVGKDAINLHLTSLTAGENVLLKYLDARNCPNLPNVDLSKCSNLEELYLDGCYSVDPDSGAISGLTSATLPTGGMLKKVHLPASITNLTIRNQTKITDLTLEGYSKLSTLVFDTVSETVQNKTTEMLHNLATGSYVRLWNFDLKFNTKAELESFVADLDRMKGTDSTGTQELPIAQVNGKITLVSDEAVDYEYIDRVQKKYQDVLFVCKVKYVVNFYTHDSKFLETQTVITSGLTVPGSVTYAGVEPIKEETSTMYYDWAGWIDSEYNRYGETNHRLVEGIYKDLTLYAYYDSLELYTVNFYNYSGTELIGTYKTINERAIPGKYETPNVAIYNGNDPVPPEGYTVDFVGWGTVAYGSIDIESEEYQGKAHRKINSVHSSMNIYVQFSWEIIGIRVSKNPTKMEYFSGEKFESSGIEITAKKRVPTETGWIEAVITNKDYHIDETIITAENTSIRIYHNETVDTYLTVYIATSMVVTKDPDQGYQETLPKPPNFKGMELTVTFSNSNTKIITEGYTVDPPDFNSEPGIKNITFVYKGLVSSPYEVIVIDYVPDDLESCSWDLISYVSNKGKAANTWHIGDEKSIFIRSTTLRYYSGTYIYRIIDFDHNIRYSKHRDPVTGEEMILDLGEDKVDHWYEYEQGKHTITFALAKKYMIPPGKEELELMEVGCYGNTFHPNPPAKEGEPMAYEPIYSWGRQNCTIRDSLVEYINSMPSDLRSKIKEVTKGQSDQDWERIPEYEPQHNEFWAEKCLTQQDKIFIPSLYEVFGINKTPDPSDKRTSKESDYCTRYAYYEANDAVFIKNSDSDMKPWKWWLRSLAYCWRSSSESNPAIYSNYDIVTSDGSSNNDYNTSTNLVTFCFNV